MDQRSGSVLCAETLRLSTGIVGAKAGNLALTVLATGGIYLAGGIPRRSCRCCATAPSWLAYATRDDCPA
jgi:glucokinase